MKVETDRMVLRPWVMEDAPALFKYASDSRVADPALWPVHTSIEMSREVLESMFIPLPMLYAMVLKTADEAVGCIGLVPEGAEHCSVESGEREVGYWIGYEHWGKGLTAEALAAFVEMCRRDAGICGLVITTSKSNVRSQRVAEKCGFKLGGECCCEGIASLVYRLKLFAD